MSTPRKLAFIGMGIMGLPMSMHLRRAGHEVAVHTRTRAKAAAALEIGARWADSTADAASGAKAVFICVTDTPDVRQVVDQLLPAVRPGQIVIDHSTISPSATRDMAAELARRGATLLDAPVSGGDVGARNGTLSIMVGGDRHAFDEAQPLMTPMGKTITYCGPSGAGQLTKLVNQVAVSLTNLAVCEALSLAGRSGLDLETTIMAIGGGAAGSWQLQNLGPRMARGDFAPGFMIDLQQKDLRLVLEAASASKTPLLATALVHQLFQRAQAQGHGRDGTQALFHAVESLGDGK